MKTGAFEQTYPINTTKWVVEGFSRRSNCHVYPHEGWSWTNWTPSIRDTYKTLAEARSAISCGYLRDMIKHQDIVDIQFYEIVTTKAVEERKVINRHSGSGEVIQHTEPTFATGVADVGAGDFVIFSKPSLYCRVRYLRDQTLGLDVINGAWLLIADIKDGRLFVSEKCDIDEKLHGKELTLAHLGVPDPTNGPDDYDYQCKYYYDNFDSDVLTSTLRVAR